MYLHSVLAISFLGLVFGGTFPPPLSNACTEASIRICIGPLAEYEEDDLSGAVVPNLSPDIMKRHCTLYHEFETCMEPIVPNCEDTDKMLFDGIQSAYKYLCDTAYDEYIVHQPCLSNPDLHHEGEFCKNSLTDRLGSIMSQQHSINYKLQRLCHYAKDYLDCVYNAVESFCGSRAAMWQRGLDERSIEPVLEAMGCIDNGRWYDSGAPYPATKPSDFLDQGLSTKLLAIIIAISVLVLVVIVVVLVYMCYKRKQILARAPPNANGEVSSSGEQVPYVVYGPGAAGAMGTATSFPMPDGALGAGEKSMLPPPYDPYDYNANQGNPDHKMPLPPGGAVTPFGNLPEYSDLYSTQNQANSQHQGEAAGSESGRSHRSRKSEKNSAPVHDSRSDPPTYRSRPDFK